MNRLTYLFLIMCIMVPAGLWGSAGLPDLQKPSKKSQTEASQPNIDGVVEVSFKIDATGKIQIVDLVSTSPQLSEYVIKKLAKIQISDQTQDAGKVIKYRFTFKKQA